MKETYYERNKEKRIKASRERYAKKKEEINLKRREGRESPRVPLLPGETPSEKLKRLARKRNDKYLSKNLEKARESKNRWKEVNREYFREYYLRNSENLKFRIKEYKKENPGYVRHHNISRKNYIRQATPSWADLAKIKEIYRHALELEKATGEKYHVDHVIPLKGKNICGLHVHTNLRVIPQTENLRKKNKYIDETSTI